MKMGFTLSVLLLSRHVHTPDRGTRNNHLIGRMCLLLLLILCAKESGGGGARSAIHRFFPVCPIFLVVFFCFILHNRHFPVASVRIIAL